MAEKWQIMETAVFGSYGSKRAVGGGNLYFYMFIITIKTTFKIWPL